MNGVRLTNFWHLGQGSQTRLRVWRESGPHQVLAPPQKKGFKCNSTSLLNLCSYQSKIFTVLLDMNKIGDSVVSHPPATFASSWAYVVEWWHLISWVSPLFSLHSRHVGEPLCENTKNIGSPVFLGFASSHCQSLSSRQVLEKTWLRLGHRMSFPDAWCHFRIHFRSWHEPESWLSD